MPAKKPNHLRPQTKRRNEMVHPDHTKHLTFETFASSDQVATNLYCTTGLNYYILASYPDSHYSTLKFASVDNKTICHKTHSSKFRGMMHLILHETEKDHIQNASCNYSIMNLEVFSRNNSTYVFLFLNTRHSDKKHRKPQNQCLINLLNRHQSILRSNSTLCELDSTKCHGKTVHLQLFHFSASVHHSVNQCMPHKIYLLCLLCVAKVR